MIPAWSHHDLNELGTKAPAEIPGHSPECICKECIDAARAKLLPRSKNARSALDDRSERILQQVRKQSGFNF